MDQIRAPLFDGELDGFRETSGRGAERIGAVLVFARRRENLSVQIEKVCWVNVCTLSDR